MQEEEKGRWRPYIYNWTADEVAECLPLRDFLTAEEDKKLYIKLWGFVNSENPTPVGGDGSNGTVETPEERLNPSNTDKVPNFWDKLSQKEQTAINKAVDKERKS